MEKKNDNFIMLPTVDICFKNLMENPEVRKGFIAALLRKNPENIKKTTLLPTILQKDYEEDKQGILDVLVHLEDGTQIDMEMQVAYYEYWDARVLFYLSKVFAGQLKKGEAYDQLKKCIHVSILDFIQFEKDKSCYRTAHFRDDLTGEMYSELMEIQVLGLKKLPEQVKGEEDIISWMRFLGGKTREEFKNMADLNKYIGIAYEELQKLSADELKRLDYESREKAIRDHKSFIRGAIRQGLKQGLDQGEALGERKKLREITEKKLNRGMTAEEIADDLEENIETIKSLYNEILAEKKEK